MAIGYFVYSQFEGNVITGLLTEEEFDDFVQKELMDYRIELIGYHKGEEVLYGTIPCESIEEVMECLEYEICNSLEIPSSKTFRVVKTISKDFLCFEVDTEEDAVSMINLSE